MVLWCVDVKLKFRLHLHKHAIKAVLKLHNYIYYFIVANIYVCINFMGIKAICSFCLIINNLQSVTLIAIKCTLTVGENVVNGNMTINGNIM